jgi:two-component system response regulator FlrC
VREVENVMQRALVLCDGDLIRAAHIVFEPPVVETRDMAGAAAAGPAQIEMPGATAALATQAEAGPAGGALAESLELAERIIILKALRTHASRASAAEELGISARTLRYKLARLRAAGVDLTDDVLAAGSAA